MAKGGKRSLFWTAAFLVLAGFACYKLWPHASMKAVDKAERAAKAAVHETMK